MQTASHPATRSEEILRNLPRIDGVIPMFVDGGWRLAAEGGTRELYNPGNGRVIATVAEATAADAEAAIAAARGAFDDGPWGSMTAADRAALLFKLADAIDAHRDEFMRIDTLNNGKPLRETEYDAVDSANCFRYYAGLATKPHGQTFDVPAPSQTFTVREPIGVCGQIVPWNYPLLMATWKLAPALAAGNVCVLKPSELTPLSALRLARIFEELDFPPGVLNIVPGAGATVGHAIAASPLVDKVAFTGGTKTGRSIMHDATTNLKKISLELGGKSPNVVFADADFDTAVDYALFGIFANAGQVCSAGSRLIVEQSLHDRFVERLVERAQKIRVGDGFDPATEMGPIISPAHRERVEAYIETGSNEGARLLCGGERLGGALAEGNFVAPTIFDDTSPNDADRPRRDFRPRFSRPNVQRRSRGAQAGQRHHLRAGRSSVHARHRKGASSHPQDASRHHVGQYVSSYLQRGAVGRIQAVGYRPRARHLRLRRLHRGEADQRQSRRRAVGLVLRGLIPSRDKARSARTLPPV